MLITNDNIRLISFLIAIFLSFVIIFSYHKMVVNIIIKKIDKAIEIGDGETACKLLNMAQKKNYRDKILHTAYKKYMNKFFDKSTK